MNTNTHASLFLVLNLVACGPGQNGIAAPLGDKKALEKLAESYKDATDGIPATLVKLPPKRRRNLVGTIFTKAGYDYSETLIRLAETSPDGITQFHRDMKELLFLPHYGIKHEHLKDIYSNQELVAIEKIIAKFN